MFPTLEINAGLQYLRHRRFTTQIALVFRHILQLKKTLYVKTLYVTQNWSRLYRNGGHQYYNLVMGGWQSQHVMGGGWQSQQSLYATKLINVMGRVAESAQPGGG